MPGGKRILFFLTVTALLFAIGISICYAEDTKVELSGFYTKANYNTSETCDMLQTTLLLSLSNCNKLWFGHLRSEYRSPQGYLGGVYIEEVCNTGGYFRLSDSDACQVDYFGMINSFSRSTGVFGAEYSKWMNSLFKAGIGYYRSNYPIYSVNQYQLRIFYVASNCLSFNTKLYYTDVSDKRSGMAVQERINVYLGPSFSCNINGATGKRINNVDNDIASFYSQYATLNSSYGLTLDWNPDPKLEVYLGYSRDSFDGYFKDNYIGGVKIKF